MLKFKSLLLLVLLTAFVHISFAKEIKSVKTGGNWNDTKTWITGEIPAQTDDVIILGHVIINSKSECNNAMVEKDGILEISGSSTGNIFNVFGTLTLEGNLVVEKDSEMSVNGGIRQSEGNHIINKGIITVSER